MSTYEALKALHVLAAAIWVGSAVASQVFAVRARKRSNADLFNFGDDAEYFGNRFLITSSLIVVLTGFGMVADADYSLGDFWLSFAIAGFAFSFILGAAVVGPTLKKVRLAREAGDEEAGVGYIGRIFFLSRIELVVLVAVVIDMVVKPGA